METASIDPRSPKAMKEIVTIAVNADPGREPNVAESDYIIHDRTIHSHCK